MLGVVSPVSQRLMKVCPSVVVVEMDMGEPGRVRGDPVPGRNTGDLDSGVSYIQTQPESGIVHLFHDLQKHIRLRFHHVFQTEDRVRRDRVQHFPPERDRTGFEPYRVIDQGDKAAVDHDLSDPVSGRETDRLTIAVQRQIAGPGIDGGGKELIEGSVERKSLHTFHGRTDDGVRPGKLRIHVRGGTVFGDLQSHTVRPGQRGGVLRRGGDIETVAKRCQTISSFAFIVLL